MCSRALLATGCSQETASPQVCENTTPSPPVGSVPSVSRGARARMQSEPWPVSRRSSCGQARRSGSYRTTLRPQVRWLLEAILKELSQASRVGPIVKALGADLPPGGTDARRHLGIVQNGEHPVSKVPVVARLGEGRVHAIHQEIRQISNSASDHRFAGSKILAQLVRHPRFRPDVVPERQEQRSGITEVREQRCFVYPARQANIPGQ